MRVEKLDHVNVQTLNVQDMADWYETVLGLKNGPRPNFPFPGAWLYAEEAAVIHLVGHSGAEAVGSEEMLKLEHFAFAATGLDAFEQRLEDLGIAHNKLDLPAIGLVQYHLRDPDGNHVHIDFKS